MNRREMLTSLTAAPLADMSERKRRLLWFRGDLHTGTGEKREVLLRMDLVASIDEMDVWVGDKYHKTGGVLTTAQGFHVLMPESYARFKAQWAEFWEVQG